jgi:hypothetical protein
MKVLIVSNVDDFRLNMVTKAIRTVGEVGIMHKYDPMSLLQYNPDIVISDQKVNHNKVFKISDLDQFGPFVDLTEYKTPSRNTDYECDAVYLGDIKEFKSLIELYKNGLHLRYYFSVPSGLACYAGNIPMSYSFDLYLNAKACPIPSNDGGFREMDIILAGGNPVIESDNFADDMKAALKGKRRPSKLSKKKILENHTNFDVASHIMTELSAYKLSNILKEKKQCLLS